MDTNEWINPKKGTLSFGFLCLIREHTIANCKQSHELFNPSEWNTGIYPRQWKKSCTVCCVCLRRRRVPFLILLKQLKKRKSSTREARWRGHCLGTALRPFLLNGAKAPHPISLQNAFRTKKRLFSSCVLRYRHWSISWFFPWIAYQSE